MGCGCLRLKEGAETGKQTGPRRGHRDLLHLDLLHLDLLHPFATFCYYVVSRNRAHHTFIAYIPHTPTFQCTFPAEDVKIIPPFQAQNHQRRNFQPCLPTTAAARRPRWTALELLRHILRSSSTSSDSRATTTAATTTDQQVISKQTLPIKSCLASSHSRSTVGSTTTRPALCEIVGGSSRLDNNGDDIHDAQAQRHDNSRRDRHDRRGRRLTFNNRTRVFLIPTLAELTTGEFAAMYRTPDDDTANQQDIIRTIQAMAQHNFHDGGALPPALLHDGDDDAASSSTTSSTTDELTTRGLEHMRSSEHVRERKETKLMVTDAILNEQEEQWGCGRTVAESEDDIADVSRAVTSRSVLEALERAAGDAAYVRRVVAHDLQCQQQQQQATAITSDMQLGRSLHNLSPADDLPHGTETSGTTSRSVDANAITVPHSTFLNQATPNSWSVASTPTTNTLLAQIASNASMAMMTNKNKMSSTTSMPTTAPTLPSVTTYLSRSAPI